MGVIEVKRNKYLVATHGPQYRLMPIDHWWREEECPRCGRKEVLMRFTGGLVLCDKCLRRWHKGEELLKTGKAKPFLNTSRDIRCMECGVWSPLLYYVTPGKLCFKCAWTVYAKKNIPLKVEGVRW